MSLVAGILMLDDELLHRAAADAPQEAAVRTLRQGGFLRALRFCSKSRTVTVRTVCLSSRLSVGTRSRKLRFRVSRHAPCEIPLAGVVRQALEDDEFVDKTAKCAQPRYAR